MGEVMRPLDVDVHRHELALWRGIGEWSRRDPGLETSAPVAAAVRGVVVAAAADALRQARRHGLSPAIDRVLRGEIARAVAAGSRAAVAVTTELASVGDPDVRQSLLESRAARGLAGPTDHLGRRWRLTPWLEGRASRAATLARARRRRRAA